MISLPRLIPRVTSNDATCVSTEISATQTPRGQRNASKWISGTESVRGRQQGSWRTASGGSAQKCISLDCRLRGRFTERINVRPHTKVGIAAPRSSILSLQEGDSGLELLPFG
jgi:hypothetical protein